MTILVLFGQRKEQYPGQYAPEVIAAVSEFNNEDNPDYMISEKARSDNEGEFESTEVIQIEVDTNTIMSRLRPHTAKIEGEIK